MHVFPGKVLTVRVDFEVGGDPVSPSVASYRIVDSTLTEVVPNTPITVPPGATSLYVVIPYTAHAPLNVGEKYRTLRMEVSFNADGGIFEKDYVYFVVPDLFLSFDNDNVRLLLGLSAQEYEQIHIDYYRAYIDLATGEIGDEFYAALMGSDPDLAMVARNLIYYSALRGVLPVLQTMMFKSLESETSKFTRFDVDFTRVNDYIDRQYAFYYAQIKLTATTEVGYTMLVVDTPVDAITGV